MHRFWGFMDIVTFCKWKRACDHCEAYITDMTYAELRAERRQRNG